MILQDAPLYESIDVSLLSEEAHQQLTQNNRYMAKLALAALVVNSDGDVLVAAHEARDGEFEQGALGSVMETFRYVPLRGSNATETPLEVFQRCLMEELQVDEVAFEKAGLYFDRQHPVSHGEWSAGAVYGYDDMYGWVASLIVRVTNPGVLVSDTRISEEILSTSFQPIPQILKCGLPMRPGYGSWLINMQRKLHLPIPHANSTAINWADMPLSDKDVRFPYEGGK